MLSCDRRSYSTSRVYGRPAVRLRSLFEHVVVTYLSLYGRRAGRP